MWVDAADVEVIMGSMVCGFESGWVDEDEEVEGEERSIVRFARFICECASTRDLLGYANIKLERLNRAILDQICNAI